MQTGSKTYAVNLLQSAIMNHQESKTIELFDKDYNKVEVTFDNLPKPQSAGTLSQRKSHAYILATGIYNEKIKELNKA